MDEDEKYQTSMTANEKRNQSIAKSTARMVRGRRVDDGRGGAPSTPKYRGRSLVRVGMILH